MERIKKKRAVLRIAASAFAVAFIVFAIMLARELWQTKKEADSFAELAAMRLPKEETQPTAGAAATSKPIQINIIVNEDNTASAETVETGAVVEGIDEPPSEEEQPEEPGAEAPVAEEPLAEEKPEEPVKKGFTKAVIVGSCVVLVAAVAGFVLAHRRRK